MIKAFAGQLAKTYKRYLQNLVAGNAFEPIVLRGDKQPSISLSIIMAGWNRNVSARIIFSGN